MVKNNSIKKMYRKYHTPMKLAQAITHWAINEPDLKILDPAFGRGVFARAWNSKSIYLII